MTTQSCYNIVISGLYQKQTFKKPDSPNKQLSRFVFLTGNQYSDPRRIYDDLVKRNINGWIDINQLASEAAVSGMVSVSFSY